MKKLSKQFLVYKKYLGISYVELLITISLAGVIGLLLIVGITTSSRLFSDQRTTTHISVQNRIALDEITNQIRSSAWVANCPSSICGSDLYTLNSQLILALWPLDVSGNPYQPPEECVFDYIVYSLDTENSKNILKETFPNITQFTQRNLSSHILATDVKNLLFDYDSTISNPTLAQSVTINLSNEASSIHRTYDIDQSITVNIRNSPYSSTTSAGGTIPINYAIHMSGDPGHIEFKSSVDTVNGDIYATGSICLELSEDTCNSGSGYTPTVNGNVYYGNDIDPLIIGDNLPRPPESPPLEQIPNINLSYWLSEASTNEVTCPFDSGEFICYARNYDLNVPIKFVGDLFVENDINITMTGAIHVTGNLLWNPNAGTVAPADSLGSNGTAIIVDKSIETIRSTNFSTNSAGGYVFLISTSTEVDGEGVPVENWETLNITGNVVFYSIGVVTIQIDNGNNITGAMIGPAIRGEDDILITYDSFLATWPGPNPNVTSSCIPETLSTLETIQVIVAANSDEAQQKGNGNDFTTNKNFLQIDSDTTSDSVINSGFRFQNVLIPQGATIISATFEGYTYNEGDLSPNITIYGHNVANSPEFNSLAPDDVTDRLLIANRTPNSVNWVADDLPIDTFVSTPDISSIIRDIVNGPWSSGNAITILLEAKTDIDDKDLNIRSHFFGEADKYAKLNIQYAE